MHDSISLLFTKIACLKVVLLISNVAILAKNTNAEAPIAEAFITAAEDAGIEICYTTYYDAETTNFSSDVTAIDAAGCDGVMLVSEMSDGRAIIEELGNQEMLGEDGITVVGHGGIGNSEFISNFSNPGLLDGIYGSRFSAPENTFEVNVFRNEYTTAFSTEPGDLAAEAYDATTLLMLAVEEANSTLGADVNNALMAVGTDHAGASGDFSFEDNGDVPGAM